MPLTCVNTSGETYILDLVEGPNMGPEAKAAGKHFDWAFIAEFKSLADLEYYVAKDPSHESAKGLLGKVFEDVFVYDIEY